MATSYSLKLGNQTDQPFYFVVWASLPASGSTNYVSGAWQIKYLNPNANVAFEWQTTWQAVQTDVKTSGGGSPVKITSVVAGDAVLADGETFPLLWEAGGKGFKFLPPVKGGSPGHVYIENRDQVATVGLGNNGVAIAITDQPVKAKLTLDMEVNPSYFLSLAQSEVINTDIVQATTFLTKPHLIKYVLGNTNFTCIAALDNQGGIIFKDSQSILSDAQISAAAPQKSAVSAH